MLLAKVVGSMFLVCLCLQIWEGGAISYRAPSYLRQNCPDPGFGPNVLKNIVIGVIAAVTSKVPIAILLVLERRGFVYQKTWTQRKKQSYLRWWTFQHELLYLLGVSYILCALTYLVGFLANGAEDTGRDWVVGTAAALLCLFLVSPYTLAVLYAVVATIAIKSDDGMIEMAR